MDDLKFGMGHMYVPENNSYSNIMKHNGDIATSCFDIIKPYAEIVCDSIQDDVTVIAEYCAADGKNSLTLIQNIIGLIKAKNTSTEIMLVYEDYTGNDYNALFRQVLKGQDIEVSITTEDVFVTASSTTMYKQCLPSNSVHFIFSFKGLYYPSKRPCIVTSSMIPMFAKPEERKLYQTQAENDWKLFLSLRSKELKPGGLMVIIPSASASDPFKHLDLALESLFKDNIISEMEFKNIYINIYARSEDELRKPFDENANEVSQLELVSIEMVKHTVFEVSSGSLGIEKASVLAKIFRTIAYNPIVDNLSEDRTQSEKENIVEEFLIKFAGLYKNYTKDVDQIYPRLIIRKKIHNA